MNPLTLSTSMIRACALGQQTLIPRKTALSMWARMNKKSALTDLVNIVSSPLETSGIRLLALQLLLQKRSVAAIQVIHAGLSRETHPRVIGVFLSTLAIRGSEKSYELLQELMLTREWPGSCLRLIVASLRVLRYRLGISAGNTLEPSPGHDPSTLWALSDWKMKPASGKTLHRSLRFTDSLAPDMKLERNFAVQFPCGNRQLSMLIHEDLNHIHPGSALFHAPALSGVLLSEKEEGMSLFGWLYTRPANQSQMLIMDVFHHQGQHLYQGSGELIEEALHCDIRYVVGAPVPAAAMSFAFRTNQLLHQARLFRALDQQQTSHDFAKSA